MSPNSWATRWQLKTRTLVFDDRPKIMGIVNVTPDSFSDGGKYLGRDQAIRHALQLDNDGADILDIGGESTRPYSDPVAAQEELDRVIPVVEALAKETSTPISIDTSKAVIARPAIAAGAEIINDVTGLEGDSDMLQTAIDSGAGVCAMHMQGTPQTMQDNPQYENVVKEIIDYLIDRRDALIDAGVAPERICLDPGIGFGKTHEHNFELMKYCGRFLELGHAVLVGHSRKGFIGRAIGNKELDRDFGTLAASLWLAHQGIHVIRVHNVAATVQGLKVWHGIQHGHS